MRISGNILTGRKLNGTTVTATVPQELIDALQALLEGQSTLEELLKDIALTNATEEEALTLQGYYPYWDSGKDYKKGERVRHPTGAGVKLFEILQAHISQEDWEPHEVPALYMDLENKLTQNGQLPTWSQPLEANDAYKKGDKVTHDGKNWRSTIDGNVWEPGIHGWEVLE